MRTIAIDGILVQDSFGRIIVDAQGVTLYVDEGVKVTKVISSEAILQNFNLHRLKKPQEMKGDAMELREILNRAEGVIINAKSFAANSGWPEVRDQLFNLHEFLNKELLNKPAEQPDTLAEVGDRMAEKMSKPAEPEKPKAIGYTAEPEKPAEPEKTAKPESAVGAGVVFGQEQSESKDGSGIVSGQEKSESKPDAGVVSKPEKSQNRDGSGIS